MECVESCSTVEAISVRKNATLDLVETVSITSIRVSSQFDGMFSGSVYWVISICLDEPLLSHMKMILRETHYILDVLTR